MTNATYAIWNGCDGYEYSELGAESFKRAEKFTAFEIEELALESLPVECGDIDFTGTILMPDNRVFMVALHD